MFDSLIADEVEAIDAYDRAMERPYPKKTLDTLDHIRDEEEEHIEELEELKTTPVTEAATATFKYNDSEEPGANAAASKEPTKDTEGEAKTEDLQEACTWICVYDGKEVGTVEASSEEEAADKMQKEYPEYHYGAYDGCFDVFKEDLNEAALNEYVLDRTVKRVGAGIKRGLQRLQGKDAAKILNSFFTRGFFIYVMEHEDFSIDDMEKAHKALHYKPNSPFKDYTEAFNAAGRISKLYETKVFLFANVLKDVSKSEFGKNIATRYGSKPTEITDGEDAGKQMPGIQLAVFEDGRALLNPGNKLATDLAMARDEKKALDKSAKKATKGGSGTARNYGTGPVSKTKATGTKFKYPTAGVMLETLKKSGKLPEEQLEYFSLATDNDFKTKKPTEYKAAEQALKGVYRAYMTCKDDPEAEKRFMSMVSQKSGSDEAAMKTMGAEADKLADEVLNKSSTKTDNPESDTEEAPKAEEQPKEVNASYYDELPDDENEDFITESFNIGSYEVVHGGVEKVFETIDEAVDYINIGMQDNIAREFTLYDRTGEYEGDLMIKLSMITHDQRGDLGYYPTSTRSKRVWFDTRNKVLIAFADTAEF